MKKIFYYLAVATTVLFISCAESDTTIEIDQPKETQIVLVLNEGGFNQNNSSLSKYDLSTGALSREYFKIKNNRGLGDAGNDMILYGSKLYIVVNVSGTVEVVDIITGKSLKQIPMKRANGDSKEPRQITAHGGKVYVTSFDDTVSRIDTTTFNIDATLTTGMDPEGMVINDGKMYVANSGGLSGFDNTLSVIDLSSFEVIDEVEVGVNPINLDIDSRGNIYISALGNYYDKQPVFQKFDPITGTVTTINEIPNPGRFAIYGNVAYIITGSFLEPTYSILMYDCVNNKIISDDFITDDTEIDVIHSLSIDENTGDLFIIESDYVIPGSVYCFDIEGKLKYSIDAVGLNPNTVITFKI